MLRQRGQRSDVLGTMLARKLDAAIVLPTSEIEPDVATLDSRVRFRVDGGAPAERILVLGAGQEILGITLLVSVPRGLALLGMSAGQSTDIPSPDGKSERITLEAVLYQPETAAEPDAVAQAMARTIRPVPPTKIASLSAFRSRPSQGWNANDGDDPGPSAA